MVTHFKDIVCLKQRQEDMQFSFQETKSLSSYASLSGCQPTCDFTHNWTFIKYSLYSWSHDKPILYLIHHYLDKIDIAWNLW